MASTPTRTELCAISLARGANGRARITSRGGPFRVITLATTHDTARVALVPDRALLIAGDDVGIALTVADGLRLHLQETSGTVAYDMRGDCASWAMSASVGVGAELVLDSLPWVSAHGSRVDRSMSVSLAETATMVARETLVLGRSDEEPGELVTRTSITRSGRPLLVEELCSAHLAPYRVIDSVLAIGRTTAIEAQALELESGDRMWRRLGQQAHLPAADLDPVWRALVSGVD